MIGNSQSLGAQMIRMVDLDDLMAQLDQIKMLTRDQRRRRREAQEAHDTFKRTVLLAAQDQLAAEEARLLLTIAGDKARFPNEEARKAGMVQAKGQDPDYQSALKVLRAAEDELARLAMAVTEATDELESARDYSWNLRSLIDGARTEITALAVFDGPKLPGEIPLRVEGNLPAEIRITAPTTLPHISLVPTKEVA